MPRNLFKLLMRPTICINRLQEPNMRHGNRQKENIRDKIGGGTALILLFEPGGFFVGRLDACRVVEVDPFGVDVPQGIYSIHLEGVRIWSAYKKRAEKYL